MDNILREFGDALTKSNGSLDIFQILVDCFQKIHKEDNQGEENEKKRGVLTV